MAQNLMKVFPQRTIHSSCRFQMLNIPDIRTEKFTGSLEKFNITILVMSLIASLLEQVWRSHNSMLNDKKMASVFNHILYYKQPKYLEIT